MAGALGRDPDWEPWCPLGRCLSGVLHPGPSKHLPLPIPIPSGPTKISAACGLEGRIQALLPSSPFSPTYIRTHTRSDCLLFFLSPFALAPHSSLTQLLPLSSSRASPSLRASVSVSSLHPSTLHCLSNYFSLLFPFLCLWWAGFPTPHVPGPELETMAPLPVS